MIIERSLASSDSSLGNGWLAHWIIPHAAGKPERGKSGGKGGWQRHQGPGEFKPTQPRLQGSLNKCTTNNDPSLHGPLESCEGKNGIVVAQGAMTKVTMSNSPIQLQLQMELPCNFVMLLTRPARCMNMQARDSQHLECYPGRHQC